MGKLDVSKACSPYCDTLLGASSGRLRSRKLDMPTASHSNIVSSDGVANQLSDWHKPSTHCLLSYQCTQSFAADVLVSSKKQQHRQHRAAAVASVQAYPPTTSVENTTSPGPSNTKERYMSHVHEWPMRTEPLRGRTCSTKSRCGVPSSTETKSANSSQCNSLLYDLPDHELGWRLSRW